MELGATKLRRHSPRVGDVTDILLTNLVLGAVLTLGREGNHHGCRIEWLCKLYAMVLHIL